MRFSNTAKETLTILKALRSDHRIVQSFDGDIRNGKIDGYYRTNTKKSPFFRYYKPGYLKVVGSYQLDEGVIELETKPATVFILALLASIPFFVISILSFTTPESEAFKSYGALFIGTTYLIGNVIYYHLEKKRFWQTFRSIYHQTVDELDEE